MHWVNFYIQYICILIRFTEDWSKFSKNGCHVALIPLGFNNKINNTITKLICCDIMASLTPFSVEVQ